MDPITPLRSTSTAPGRVRRRQQPLRRRSADDVVLGHDPPASLPVPLPEDEPVDPPVVEVDLDTIRSAGRARSLGQRWSAPSSPVPTYVGLALVALGFTLITYTWGRVAGTLSVALQLPYIASGGFTGIGLVVVGATVISVSARRRDAATRAAQLRELGVLLRAVAEHNGSVGATTIPGVDPPR